MRHRGAVILAMILGLEGQAIKEFVFKQMMVLWGILFGTVGFFYSVSISGYHIAKAGANPISRLSNGFTYVESYLGRGDEKQVRCQRA